MSRYIFVIDADRCIGCKGCQVACKIENEVALGANRNKVYDVGPTGVFPELEMYFLPVMCQQCENPSCVAVCPTNACYRNESDHVILSTRTSASPAARASAHARTVRSRSTRSAASWTNVRSAHNSARRVRRLRA